MTEILVVSCAMFFMMIRSCAATRWIRLRARVYLYSAQDTEIKSETLSKINEALLSVA